MTTLQELTRRVLIVLLAIACWGGPAPAKAAPIHLTILSGTGWLTSTIPTGANAVNATAPYPNPISQPSDILPGTAAQLMWNCQTGCTPLNGANGPNEANFRYEFNLALADDSFPLIGQAFVIADDFFEMYVNGSFAGAARLDDHKDPITNQPLPVVVDFTHLLQSGANVIAIRACDGAINLDNIPRSFCFNRGFEYVFFDGTIQTIPEPASLLLFGVACLAMIGQGWWLGRRRS